MKLSATLFLLVFTLLANGQILTVGGSVGTTYKFAPWAFGGMIEIKPKTAMLALNFDPSVSFYDGELSFNYPIYLKFIFGKNFRVCPTFGFIGRTKTANIKASTGGTLGLMFEKRVRENDFVFLKFDYMNEGRKYDSYSPGGSPYQYISYQNSLWISIGYRTVLF